MKNHKLFRAAIPNQNIFLPEIHNYFITDDKAQYCDPKKSHPITCNNLLFGISVMVLITTVLTELIQLPYEDSRRN